MPYRVAVLVASVLALACTGEPISNKVGPGSTVSVSLPELVPGMSPGFASTLAPEDRQRGGVTFVLCLPTFPGCDPAPSRVPRQGYRLTTSYFTRAEADRASARAGERLHVAAVQVPAAGPHRPPPGKFRLEPRLVRAGAAVEVPLIPEARIRTLEITGLEATPSPLHETLEQLAVVVGGVPRPAVAVFQLVPDGDVPAASAELEIRVPDAKVVVADAKGTVESAFVDMVRLDAETIRVLWIARPGAPEAPIKLALELYFDLRPNASPALASEFTIVSQRAYDASGVLLPVPQFALGGIF